MSAPRIVVLGAGYAGLEAARDLGGRREAGSLPPGTEIHLVDRADHHTLTYWLHQVAAGTRTPADARLPLARLALPGILRHQAAVRALDPQHRRLELAGEDFHFDHAVIALGGTARLPAIPGLAEHAHTLRTPEAAEALHQALDARLEQAAATAEAQERRRLLTVVVAGGGYTGCQLAGDLARQWPQRAARRGLRRDETRVVLAEGAPHLLPGQPGFQGGYAEGALARQGVEVHTGTPLSALDGETAYLAEEPLPCGLLAWAGGLAGPRPALDALPAGEDGRIAVTPHLQVEGFPRLWAAGDAALPTSAPPATAHEAVAQGRTVAANIAAQLNGQRPARHQPSRRGLVVSLGPDDAVGHAGPFGVAGRPAACLKRGAERAYVEALLDRPH
jgi:NADH dehydrogenase